MTVALSLEGGPRRAQRPGKERGAERRRQNIAASCPRKPARGKNAKQHPAMQTARSLSLAAADPALAHPGPSFLFVDQGGSAATALATLTRT